MLRIARTRSHAAHDPESGDVLHAHKPINMKKINKAWKPLRAFLFLVFFFTPALVLLTATVFGGILSLVEGWTFMVRRLTPG